MFSAALPLFVLRLVIFLAFGVEIRGFFALGSAVFVGAYLLGAMAQSFHSTPFCLVPACIPRFRHQMLRIREESAQLQ